MSYDDLRLFAGMFDDVQRFRIAAENRIRSAAADPDIVGAALDHYRQAEHDIGRAMKRELRRCASPGILTWQKEESGIGEPLLARLLGQVGDPRIAEPRHWEGSGTDRVLIDDEPHARTVSQLWSYCGHGDPARRMRKGITADELAALGDPRAKMLVHLIAESCVKSGVRKCDDGETRTSIAHYGAVYLDCRSKYEDHPHSTDCVRCGPSGRPAPAGSTWSKAHQHAAALRKVGKEVLRDLWRAAGVNGE